MKKSIFSLKKAAILVGASMLSVSAFAHGWMPGAANSYPQFCEHINRGGVCFAVYEVDEKYSNYCYVVNDLRKYGFNDVMSSVSVPAGWYLILYENINLNAGEPYYANVMYPERGNYIMPSNDTRGGAYKTFNLTNYTTIVGNRSWNDRVSSFKACRYTNW